MFAGTDVPRITFNYVAGLWKFQGKVSIFLASSIASYLDSTNWVEFNQHSIQLEQSCCGGIVLKVNIVLRRLWKNAEAEMWFWWHEETEWFTDETLEPRSTNSPLTLLSHFRAPPLQGPQCSEPFVALAACQAPLSASQTLANMTNISHKKTLGSMYYYHPHFRNGETRAQRCWLLGHKIISGIAEV